ncbi:MAG: c-type cytochrome [Burkholderiales bacterium]|nr:c-type cytochrome [Burkholderiales bacterium]
MPPRRLAPSPAPAVHRTLAGSHLAVLTMIVCTGCDARDPDQTAQPGAGDARAGRRAIAQIECGVCHVIPGVPGARGQVGPTLAGFARRAYIAGSVPNEPQHLLQWILDPPSISPSTAMPRMPITPEQAHDMVAYLYTLK